MINDDEAVKFCNDAFYQAFLDKDFPAMEQIWAVHAPLLCIHPGGPALTRREEVMGSWRYILNHQSAQAIGHSNNEVIRYGDFVLLTCYEWDERQPENRLLATNGFVKEDGRYRMVTHQSGPVSELVSESRSEPTPARDTPGSQAVH